MSLRNGLDLVAIATVGTYTETYASAAAQDNMNSLFASWGLLEDAPAPPVYISVLNVLGKFRARLGLTPY